MRKLLPWVKLPSRWIEERGLWRFRWVKGEGSANLAALMALMVVAHNADADTGAAELTYDEMTALTGLSRAKLASGLKLLEARALIVRQQSSRSKLQLANYDPKGGWAKLPARGLYRHDTVTAFRHFTLRSPAELDALKLYYLFAARRDRRTNFALITFDTIEEYSGIKRANIPRATSMLAANSLVHISQIQSGSHLAHAYRLAHLHAHIHMGTRGRGMDSADLFVAKSG
jgi:hypothetical protein